MRKVFIKVEIKVVINLDEGIELSKIIENMDYDFVSNNDEADVIETELLGYEVIDSK
jgi:hypothetical protein